MHHFDADDSEEYNDIWKGWEMFNKSPFDRKEKIGDKIFQMGPVAFAIIIALGLLAIISLIAAIIVGG